jgi:hypothetical protein
MIRVEREGGRGLAWLIRVPMESSPVYLATVPVGDGRAGRESHTRPSTERSSRRVVMEERRVVENVLRARSPRVAENSRGRIPRRWGGKVPKVGLSQIRVLRTSWETPSAQSTASRGEVAGGGRSRLEVDEAKRAERCRGGKAPTWEGERLKRKSKGRYGQILSSFLWESTQLGKSEKETLS